MKPPNDSSSNTTIISSLSSEVEKSAETLLKFQNSSKKLRSNIDLLREQKDILQQGKSIVTKLERQKYYDSIIENISVGLFTLFSLYLILGAWGFLPRLSTQLHSVFYHPIESLGFVSQWINFLSPQNILSLFRSLYHSLGIFSKEVQQAVHNL